MNKNWIITKNGYCFGTKTFAEDVATEIIGNELESLYVDGIVNRNEEGFTIPHRAASKLSAEERELLQLPAIFPYFISVKTHGDMGRGDFQYIVEFLQPDRTPFVRPKVIGSYIEITEEAIYMFNNAQYEIVRIAQSCNEQVKQIKNRSEAINFNLENVAEIKKYGKKTQALLDSYLQNEQIVVPDKMTINVNKNTDGSYFVEPVLLEQDGNAVSLIAESHSFGEVFKKRNTVAKTYLGRDRTRYVFKDELAKGLQEIKKHQRLEKGDVDRLLAQPRETFDSDVFVFDLKFYATRVKEIGEYIRKNLPYLKLTPGGWLPEEGTISSEAPEEADKPELEVNKDNVLELHLKIAEAQEKKESFIEFDGKQYPITSQLLDKVNKCYFKFYLENPEGETASDANNAEYGGDIPGPAKKAEQVLIIKDNFDELDFKAKCRNKSVPASINETIFGGLNENIKLFEHQKEGIRWILGCWQHGYRGVLLADDMGLGKTAQAFAFISGIKAYIQDMESVLVIAPVSLLKNWSDEYGKFVKANLFSEVVELYGGKVKEFKKSGKLDLSLIAKNKIVLTTYETLREYQLSIGLIKWSVMIIDEAQKIKNPTAMVSMAVKAMQYDFGIALTGTPVENSWIDLWSIMDFVVPGQLKSLKEFTQSYQTPLAQLKEDSIGLEKLGNNLKNELSPVFLRRLKKDYLSDLPAKNVEKLKVKMPPIQKKVYEEIVDSAKQKKEELKKKSVLNIIAQLRDVSLCPNLGTYSDEAFMKMDVQAVIGSSARLLKTFEILKCIEKRNEKVLIFVTSRKMQRILRQLIMKVFNKVILPPINGEIISERRQEIVDEFNQTDGFSVLILSAEAGGVGFNITSANNVIHLSRCWNPAKEDQATDRVYRIGQKKAVNVYIPIAYDPDYGEQGSFDEKLDELLDFKRNLSESVLFPVGDSEDDGIGIFIGIMDGSSDASDKDKRVQSYWTLDELNNVTGSIFESIICDLYNGIDGYIAEKTPDSNDNGADIVVRPSNNGNEPGILIQCKQTRTKNNVGPDGVQAICSAIKYYENLYHCKFDGVVLTNGIGFTSNAKIRAKFNGIRLIARDEVGELLTKYPVKKKYH